MSQSVVFALNHIASPQLKFAEFLRLARTLDISAVEIRNDIPGVAISDGTPAAVLKREAESAGVEILSINALQQFNDWDPIREQEAVALSGYARECGAKALV